MPWGKNIQIVITGLKAQPLRMLKRINIVPGLLSERNLFPSFDDFTTWLIRETHNFSDSELFFSALYKFKNEKVGIKYSL